MIKPIATLMLLCMPLPIAAQQSAAQQSAAQQSCGEDKGGAKAGGCNAPSTAACAQATSGNPLTREEARAIVRTVRSTPCGLQARGVLCNRLDAVQGFEQAEALVVAIREAESEEAATLLVLEPRVARARKPLPAVLPAMLAATGFYASTSEKRIGDGFVPYEVNSPLWSDGAKKQRFVRVPEGQTIGFHKDKAWDFPVGTTFLQELYVGSGKERRFIETRVIVKRKAGLEFASYVWNEAQSDAERATEGTELYVNYDHASQLWKVVPEAQCVKCHSDSAQILGVRTAQLNRTHDGQSQLATLAARGVLSRVPESLEALPCLTDPSDEAESLERRARSYMHVNCSTCHQPGGAGSGTLDLRLTTPLEATGIVRPRLARRRAAAVPGHPKKSMLIHRMTSVDWDRMPNLQSTVPDEAALALIEQWIASLDPTATKTSPTTMKDGKACDANACQPPARSGCGERK